MSLFKRLTAAFVIISVLFTLAACGAGNDVRIYVSLESMPQTLDAQTAGSDIELLVCRNIYEGLTRKNEKGEVVLAACEKYDYSALKFTFTLRAGLTWENGDPLTAADFAFGLKRALLPVTKAPFARLLYAIKGAKQVNAGTASADTLGVTVKDERTLIIELEAEDKNFFETLSYPVCMPCSEKFFDGCTGRYGLQKEYVLSNGSYRLARWNKTDNGIRLYKNEKYGGEFTAKNGGVFLAKDKEKTVAEKLISGDSDMAILPGEYLPEVQKSGLKTVSVQNICWVLSLGGELNAAMRKAFCLCYLQDRYRGDLPQGFEVANSFVPGALRATVKNNDDGEMAFSYDPSLARNLLADEIKKLKNKKFPQTVLVYSNSGEIRPAITDIVGDWQDKLGTFINIKPTDKSLESELKDHSQAMCAFPVKADSYLDMYLSKFGVGSYGGSIVSADTAIAKSNNLLPIAFENTTFGYRDNISGIRMDAFGGYIDFSFIIKK